MDKVGLSEIPDDQLVKMFENVADIIGVDLVDALSDDNGRLSSDRIRSEIRFSSSIGMDEEYERVAERYFGPGLKR